MINKTQTEPKLEKITQEEFIGIIDRAISFFEKQSREGKDAERGYWAWLDLKKEYEEKVKNLKKSFIFYGIDHFVGRVPNSLLGVSHLSWEFSGYRKPSILDKLLRSAEIRYNLFKYS